MLMNLLSFLTASIFSSSYAIPVAGPDHGTLVSRSSSCWKAIQARSIGSVASYTDRCSTSFDKTKPIVEYVLIVDAGSSGSRIHIYKFNHCKESPELESEIFDSTTPGLSSYAKDPEAAAKSLDELLDVAAKNVPEELHACTPIAVKATAGLRLLGDKESQAIIDAVQCRLEKSCPFALVKDNGVEVLDGKSEGVYGWITVNYLRDSLAVNASDITAATFDLGGASTQIVFQPQNGMVVADVAEKYLLTINGRNFELYQHSYLGYGLNEARKAIFHQTIQDATAMDETIDVHELETITSPCIPPGQNQSVRLQVDGNTKEYHFVGKEKPCAHECREITDEILHKNMICAVAPCAFDGIYQPSFQESFPKGDLYLFSAFYYRTKQLHLPAPFATGILHQFEENICAADYSQYPPELAKELSKDSQYCLDLNYISSLLERGYGIPKSRKVYATQELKGIELGWTLGAALPLLEHHDCKIEKVGP
ncbi:putative guanosine-diphosphatase [Neolecta irregularis DAH-3]|uniref:guanosine-diphosphatase n=1 Tax=Neolecta irregularis (strain DAH-3) TaxID=1198029 RepID=A0A1U7LNE0_NEOID|nr:putative guanosine-diphosphatase [Neolecta irregularis DAH-3]|eukprot:OLL24167.1 putative guanosine-diphosphatase [Neolecta irregularis DAH-3]